MVAPASPRVVSVPSASQAGRTHDVYIWPGGIAKCTCPGYSWRHSCRHLSQAAAQPFAHCGRCQRVYQYSDDTFATRMYCPDCRHYMRSDEDCGTHPECVSCRR